MVCVPRIPYKCLKPFWSDELDRLKEFSIDMHNLWSQCGKPRSGVINTARLKAKNDYKLAIKRSAFEFEKIHADEISEYLIEKDSVKFWKAWNSYSKIADTPVCVAGKSDPVEIANEFKTFFDGVYVNSADDAAAVDEFARLRRTVTNSTVNHVEVNVETIENCGKRLKFNKAAGVDGIFAEHIIHSFPSLFVHLKLLFVIKPNHSHVLELISLVVVF